MGLRAAFLFFLVAGAVSPRASQAYVSTVMDDGRAVRWRGQVRLPLAGNVTNRSGIDPSSLFNAVVRSLQRWKTASGGTATFDYWQGTDRKVFEPNSTYNGLSSIYFASNTDGGSKLSPNVLGLTQVWYSTDSGTILEADVVLNDIDYRFTTNPRDTSGFGGAGSGSTVFIENVLTHELGHAFGFSHSGGLQSTMLFMESPEQAYLGCDEQVGIRAFYPSSDASSRGTITGTVVADTTGQPVFGAHVLAVSRRRGVVLSSGITDSQGSYSIGGLEAGQYFLVAEPYFAGPSALPSYYKSINPFVCGGQVFGRTALTGSDGTTLSAVGVGGGAGVSAPTIAVRCTGSNGGASVTASSASTSFASAPTVFSGGAGGFGVSDRFSSSSTLYYRLAATSGRIEVHALSYSMYSPVEPVIALLNASGTAVQAQKADNIYTGSSGYVNYDSALIAENLPAGDYVVAVTSKTRLSASSYPAGPLALDAVPFVVVTGSVNEGSPVLAGSLPVNGRCRMDENFGAYSSPAGAPERHSLDGDEGGLGFCGTLAAAGAGKKGPGGRGPMDGQGPGAGAIAGWFLPWAMMALGIRALKLTSRRRQSADGCASARLPVT